MIDFWAPWCGPCRAISPHLETIAKDTAGVHFYKLNIDDLHDVAQELSIRSVRHKILIDFERFGIT